MAASEDRAERIRELKAARPDLTWDRIGDYCGVKERSAVQWARTGGITHENCERLATLFEVDVEWLWSGRQRPADTGDLMAALVPGPTQLDRIEITLAEQAVALREQGEQLVQALAQVSDLHAQNLRLVAALDSVSLPEAKPDSPATRPDVADRARKSRQQRDDTRGAFPERPAAPDAEDASR